jgi:hypothetical protein
MSDRYNDVLPLIIGALVGLFIYMSRKKSVAPSGSNELNITVNETVSISTDASLLVASPSDVVVNDGINISTSANLSVTAPSPPPSAETNVIVNDGVNISTSASLSVA